MAFKFLTPSPPETDSSIKVFQFIANAGKSHKLFTPWSDESNAYSLIPQFLLNHGVSFRGELTPEMGSISKLCLSVFDPKINRLVSFPLNEDGIEASELEFRSPPSPCLCFSKASCERGFGSNRVTAEPRAGVPVTAEAAKMRRFSGPSGSTFGFSSFNK
jgi:hypothetical protein